MLFQPNFVVLALVLVSSSAPVALGRELILERDGRPFYLYRRRFGQENSPTLNDIRASCPGGLCDTIAGKAVSALLAGADPCAQQAISEELIDSSSQFDQATADKMIAAAVAFRQAEKNTPPDFTQNPPALRNSVFCLTPPKFPQLEGLNQAQDPNNDPNLFFDPTTKATVLKGSQANTFPLGSGGEVDESGTVAAPSSTASASGAATTAKGGVGEVAVEAPPSQSCPTAVTVTVSGTATSTPTEPAVTVTVGGSSAAAATATATAGNAGGSTGSAGTGAGTDQTGGTAPSAPTGDGAGAADFGICTTPEIDFGVGFDGRKETSFQPKDLVSYQHGSAQNINIITQFICDTLTNKCKANQAAKDLCAQAQAAAAAGTAKTGGQADDFNIVFGIQTNFAAVASVDDQGRVIAGTGTASGSTPAGDANTGNTATVTASSGTASTGASDSGPTSTSTSSQAGSTSSGANTNTGANTGNTGTTSGNTNNRSANTVSNPSPPAVSQAATNASSKSTAGSNAATTATNNAANLQTFSGNLGAAAPVVTDLGNGKFETDGNQFNSLKSAIERSCAVQNNQCANAANASGNKNGLTVADCNKQQASCNGQAGGN